MPHFPLEWTEEVDSLDVIPSQCPYSFDEIENYLQRCHYHLLLDEKPMTYTANGVVAERIEGGRRFWLVEASDEVNRQWFVLVGTGASPVEPDRKMPRWMIASENDLALAPEDYLDEQLMEQRVFDQSRLKG